jgi:hypothetical protein
MPDQPRRPPVDMPKPVSRADPLSDHTHLQQVATVNGFTAGVR